MHWLGQRSQYSAVTEGGGGNYSSGLKERDFQYL